MSCFISLSSLVFLLLGKELISSLAPDPIPCMSRFLPHDNQGTSRVDENPNVVLSGSREAAGSYVQLQEVGNALRIVDGAAAHGYYPACLPGSSTHSVGPSRAPQELGSGRALPGTDSYY